MLQIWLVRCECLWNQETYAWYWDNYRERLTIDRKQKIEKIKSERGKAQSLGAGIMECHAFGELGFDARTIRTEVSEHGKPAYYDEKSGEELYLNLSHAGAYIAAICGESSVGIDVEQIREPRLAVARRFFTEREWKLLEEAEREERAALFFRIWTLKEAFLKTTGEGLTRELASFDVSAAVDGESALIESVELRSLQLGQSIVSVGAKGKLPASIPIKTLDLADRNL